MYSTYHFKSSSEITIDLLEAIKAAFKEKPVVITVEEDNNEFELSAEMKDILEERLEEDESIYLSADASIKKLHKK